MKNWFLFLILALTAFSGCRRASDDVWEDTKTAGRHMQRGVKSLGGKQGDSRAVLCREDFMAFDMDEMEFVPMEDMQAPDQYTSGEFVATQPRETPGDPNSSLPSIEAFRDPSFDPNLAHLFRTVHFGYNTSLVQDQRDLTTLKNIAYYLQNNPHTYVFISGHCDERGADAYNLALGSRRSNSVRNLLIQEGVNPNNIFAISYGKERPIVFEHHEEAWAQNRRAEFRIYQR